MWFVDIYLSWLPRCSQGEPQRQESSSTDTEDSRLLLVHVGYPESASLPEAIQNKVDAEEISVIELEDVVSNGGCTFIFRIWYDI